MRVSSRARSVSESGTLRLSSEAARLRAGGADIVSLLEGEPDMPVPEPVARATEEAIRSGLTKYSASAGLPELRAALSRKLKDENRVEAAPADILVTNGAKQAVYEVLQALCEPGDEVLIPSPCWVTFPESVKLAGGVPVLVPCGEDHQLDPSALERAITTRTRAIILNSPNNPTGAVYPEAALRAVAALAEKRNLAIISDEAYEALVYDGEHVSVASLGPATAARTITIQTFSKSFGMTGFRVGYAAGPSELMKAVARVHGHVTGNVCTFAQHGALAALTLGDAHRASWRAAHKARRDLAYELGSRLFACVKPQGGLFLFADARCPDSAALAARALEKGVAVVPGSAFGREGFLRLSFSAPEAALREGFARLEKAL
jgi:aspartate aminotransferase